MGMFGGDNQSQSDFKKGLNKVYTWYTGGFIGFVVVLAILEQMGLSRGLDRLPVPGGDGAAVCRHRRDESNQRRGRILCGRAARAGHVQRHGNGCRLDVGGFVYRHGRHLYLTGYGGLAFILGWTGGYCLVALFLAPYLRKFGQFTIPDFLGARYEGNLPRIIGVSVPSCAPSPMWWRRSMAWA